MSIITQEKEPHGAAPAAGFFRRHGQKVLGLLFWAIVLGGYWFYTRSNDLTAVESARQLAGVLTASTAGPLIYIGVYVLRPLILFPATIITVLGGFLFGPLWGVLYVIIGSNSSAMVAYLVGRFFGSGLLDSEEGASLAQRYAVRIRANSFESVLLMRLIFLPYDLVNYLSGFLRIDWKAFLLGTAIGSIPGTISFVLLASSFGTLDELLNGELALNPTALTISVVLIVVSIALSRILKRKETSNE